MKKKVPVTNFKFQILLKIKFFQNECFVEFPIFFSEFLLLIILNVFFHGFSRIHSKVFRAFRRIVNRIPSFKSFQCKIPPKVFAKLLRKSW